MALSTRFGLFSASVTWFGFTRTREPSTRTSWRFGSTRVPKFGNQLAIDLNATIGDDFLAFTARAEARLSEKFLQANAFIVMIVRLGGAGNMRLASFSQRGG